MSREAKRARSALESSPGCKDGSAAYGRQTQSVDNVKAREHVTAVLRGRQCNAGPLARVRVFCLMHSIIAFSEQTGEALSTVVMLKDVPRWRDRLVFTFAAELSGI